MLMEEILLKYAAFIGERKITGIQTVFRLSMCLIALDPLNF